MAELSVRFEHLCLDREPQPTSPKLPFMSYQSLPPRPGARRRHERFRLDGHQF